MKRAICLMVVSGGGLLLGCGGGGSDSGSESTIAPTVKTPERLSKANFIKEGDGYCAEVNAALGGISDSGGGSDPAAQRASLYKELIAHLRGLGTPTDSAGLDEFLGAGDEIVTAEGKASEASQSGDDAALTTAQAQASDAESRFASAGAAYGFQDCGQGATTTSGTATAPATATPVAPTATTPVPTTTPVPAPVAPPSGTTGSGGGTSGGGAPTTGGGGSGGTSGGVGPG